MNRTVVIIVVADGAVEIVVAENPVERFELRRFRGLRPGRHYHPLFHRGPTRATKLAVYLDNAGVASLNRPKLRVVANLRNFRTRSVDQFD